MRHTLAVVFCLSLALVGCKAKELAEKADIAKNLEQKGTTDLMEEIAKDEYTAPEHGRLTEAQVQMYLKVREKEKAIAQVAKEQLKAHAEKSEKSGEKSLAGALEGFKALGSLADVATADVRAAHELGFNTQEYLWVKGQVLEASGAAMTEQMNKALTSNSDNAYAEAKKAYDEAKDETTKKMYAEMLASYDKSKEEMKAQQTQVEPHVAHNRQLLAKYENALNAIAQEMTKWSDQPQAEAEKAAQDWQKQVDAAAKSANQ